MHLVLKTKLPMVYCQMPVVCHQYWRRTNRSEPKNRTGMLLLGYTLRSKQYFVLSLELQQAQMLKQGTSNRPNSSVKLRWDLVSLQSPIGLAMPRICRLLQPFLMGVAKQGCQVEWMRRLLSQIILCPRTVRYCLRGNRGLPTKRFRHSHSWMQSRSWKCRWPFAKGL